MHTLQEIQTKHFTFYTDRFALWFGELFVRGQYVVLWMWTPTICVVTMFQTGRFVVCTYCYKNLPFVSRCAIFRLIPNLGRFLKTSCLSTRLHKQICTSSLATAVLRRVEYCPPIQKGNGLCTLWTLLTFSPSPCRLAVALTKHSCRYDAPAGDVPAGDGYLRWPESRAAVWVRTVHVCLPAAQLHLRHRVPPVLSMFVLSLVRNTWWWWASTFTVRRTPS